MDGENNKSGDGQLITLARNDHAAFVELYRRHYDAVFRYCAHRLFERMIAEDVTSEVFLKVVEKFGQFKGNERQFRTWLYRVATNACNNYLRKSARRNNLLESVHERKAEADYDCDGQSDKLAILREAILALKPRYQTIIMLRFFENLKTTEIAEVLASSPGTVRSQLARALTKLRDKLAGRFAEKSEVIENER